MRRDSELKESYFNSLLMKEGYLRYFQFTMLELLHMSSVIYEFLQQRKKGKEFTYLIINFSLIVKGETSYKPYSI